MTAKQIALFEEAVREGRGGFDVGKFVESFPVLVEAEGGIKKLRRLVVRLGLGGFFRDTLAPLAIWPTATLEECVGVLDSKRIPVNEDEREKRNHGKHPSQLFPYYGATRQQGLIAGYLFDEELVLLGEDGVPFLEADRQKAYIVRGKCWVNNHAHVLRPTRVTAGWLCHVLNTTDYSNRITGTTRAKLTQGKMLDIPVPLPPLSEQKRIVAKVDELMRLLDDLEAKQTTAREVQARFRASALEALTTAEGPEELGAAWERVAGQFEVVFDLPTTIDELRQSVLWAAVHGSLTTRDGGRTGAGLLDQIRSTRRLKWEESRLAKLRAEGNVPKGDGWKTKYRAGAVADSGDQLVATIPSAWAVASLDEVAEVIDPNPSHRYPTYRDGVVPLLSTREFRGRDGWDATGSNVPRVPVGVHRDQDTRCRFSPRDIIMARKGRLGLARHSPPLPAYVFSHTLFVIKVCDEMDADYVLWFLRLDAVVEWLLREMNDNTGVPTLGKGTTERLPLPVPPLAEQKRIVAKVDVLMKLCDDLEAKLEAKEATASKLVEAVVAEMVA